MMTREDQISSFDPNGPGKPGKLFGLPFDPESSQLIIIPIPWEATVTYRPGTAGAPDAVLEASQQIDLYHPLIPDGWKLGMSMLPVPQQIRKESELVRGLFEKRNQDGADSALIVEKINERCENLNVYVKSLASQWLDNGKVVGLLGGDHSSPLGLIRALSDRNSHFGILQIDAHADLRKAYESVTYSHGSIMYNALKLSPVGKLVQVGVRDYCEEEFQYTKKAAGRVKVFYDEYLTDRKGDGHSWKSICHEIVNELPDKVYISMDIDGLNPSLCPNTGTPVPGGLQFEETVTLIRTLAESGRQIIGFDLNEVGAVPGQPWDAIVGARILWQLCHWTAVSRGLLSVSRGQNK